MRRLRPYHKRVYVGATIGLCEVLRHCADSKRHWLVKCRCGAIMRLHYQKLWHEASVVEDSALACQQCQALSWLYEEQDCLMKDISNAYTRLAEVKLQIQEVKDGRDLCASKHGATCDDHGAGQATAES